jgi:hypothetical protein
MKARGIQNGIDMDWWSEEVFAYQSPKDSNKDSKQARITYLPAQHFSARGLTDRNKTLW